MNGIHSGFLRWCTKKNQTKFSPNEKSLYNINHSNEQLIELNIVFSLIHISYSCMFHDNPN